MLNKSNTRALCIGLLASLFSISVCADALDEVKEKGELVVGTEMQFAPFDFLENDKQTGLNADIFKVVGEEMGVEVRFLDLPWASVLPGLSAKNFDLVGGPLSVTKERKERYRFLTPIAEATVALLKRAGDDSITAPEDIAGKEIGAGQGSAQLRALEDYTKTLNTPVEIKGFVDNNQAYAALAVGRIDAVANSLPNIGYVAKQRPNTFEVVQPPFGEPAYFSYMGRNDEDSRALLDAISSIISEMKADGRLAELQEKWLGQSMDTPTGDFEPVM